MKIAKCISFRRPLTFAEGHKISRKINACNTVECESYEHLLLFKDAQIRYSCPVSGFLLLVCVCVCVLGRRGVGVLFCLVHARPAVLDN